MTDLMWDKQWGKPPLCDFFLVIFILEFWCLDKGFHLCHQSWSTSVKTGYIYSKPELHSTHQMSHTAEMEQFI